MLAGALNVALDLGAGPPPAQLLVATAVLALLERGAKGQPLLMVIDDLPWLDRASALVLGMVARRLTGLPAGLLAASRTGEPNFFEQGNLPVARVAPRPAGQPGQDHPHRHRRGLPRPAFCLPRAAAARDPARPRGGRDHLRHRGPVPAGRGRLPHRPLPWDEAQELVDEGLQLCATHGYDLLTWPGRLTSALLAATRGDCERAIETARDMDAWATPRRAGIIGAYASHIRGLAALGQEDFETAFRNAAAISPPGVLAPYAPHALWVFHDLVEAAMYTGREAAAAAHIAAARECHLERLSPRLRLVVLASAAIAAIAEPGTDTAAPEHAITEPGNDRWPFDLARIQLAYGSHLRRIKRTTDARRQLAGAAEIFRRLGAVPWAARADRELRATGITISTTDAGLASLTPQQRQIALLAAAGHTNKEIATRLFLSPRTVSTHLYQVFPKLGITSRAALRDALGDTPPE